MQPIPKELQGTKAIPFMEWCIKNAVLTLVTQNGQIRENYFEIPEYFLNFFNQSFTPEMLTEYFEGKYVNRDNNYFYRFKIKSNKTISFNLGTSPMYLNIENDYKPDKLIQLFPKSLNDLITLCTLADAGVELTWKGEK
jgi:hypothetical protein